ncbi:MAG TPA: RES family NAD+ phosphorylase [Bryobacteraceae bacterium]|nr:RES family NAD+ phosphorylase [Bryobacteraceae bacterium]
MTVLWRLYRAAYGPGLDGIGGIFADGRWHARGDLVVYFGGTAAICVLERLAHTDPDLLPADLRLARFEFPGTVEPCGALPANWERDESVTRELAAKWREAAASGLLAVPSAILPEELNFVCNPKHADARGLRQISERPFRFDARLI